MTNVTRAILAIHSVEYLDEVKRRRHLIDIRCCQPIRCPFFFTGDACSARSIVLIRVPCFPTGVGVYCNNCNVLQFGVIYHSLTHHRQYLNNIINYPIEYKITTTSSTTIPAVLLTIYTIPHQQIITAGPLL